MTGTIQVNVRIAAADKETLKTIAFRLRHEREFGKRLGQFLSTGILHGNAVEELRRDIAQFSLVVLDRLRCVEDKLGVERKLIDDGLPHHQRAVG